MHEQRQERKSTRKEFIFSLLKRGYYIIIPIVLVLFFIANSQSTQTTRTEDAYLLGFGDATTLSHMQYLLLFYESAGYTLTKEERTLQKEIDELLAYPSIDGYANIKPKLRKVLLEMEEKLDHLLGNYA